LGDTDHAIGSVGEDARVVPGNVTYFVHEAVTLAVVDRRLAQELWFGWIVHDPQLHPKATDVTVTCEHR
jgi:hypothetical protein